MSATAVGGQGNRPVARLYDGPIVEVWANGQWQIADTWDFRSELQVELEPEFRLAVEVPGRCNVPDGMGGCSDPTCSEHDEPLEFDPHSEEYWWGEPWGG